MTSRTDSDMIRRGRAFGSIEAQKSQPQVRPLIHGASDEAAA